MMYELFEAQSALIRQNQFMAKVATSLLGQYMAGAEPASAGGAGWRRPMS